MNENLSKPQFVRGRSSVRINSQRQVHEDRRTKRERDRSTVTRKAIERSKDDS